MEYQEIRKIVELMDKHGLSEFELERDGNRITLKKRGEEPPVISTIPTAILPPVATGEPAAADPDADPDAEAPKIKSPMVGTFYRKPTPEDKDFVQVGDKVDEDTVVCIVEAMKVMNEIKAEIRGTIRKILVDDSTPVQYGEPLFVVTPV